MVYLIPAYTGSFQGLELSIDRPWEAITRGSFPRMKSPILTAFVDRRFQPWDPLPRDRETSVHGSSYVWDPITALERILSIQASMIPNSRDGEDTRDEEASISLFPLSRYLSQISRKRPSSHRESGVASACPRDEFSSYNHFLDGIFISIAFYF